MGQNYNLNSTFGFNVTQRKPQQPKPEKQPKIDLNTTIGNLLDSMTSYVSENESVLNGDVARQIGMYSRQAMIVGMNMRAAEPKRRFDVNI